LAAQRFGITTMRTKHIPWASTLERTPARDNFKPLCDVLGPVLWKTYIKQLAKYGIRYAADFVNGSATGVLTRTDITGDPRNRRSKWYEAVAASIGAQLENKELHVGRRLATRQKVRPQPDLVWRHT
jgi:hypothetical protein